MLTKEIRGMIWRVLFLAQEETLFRVVSQEACFHFTQILGKSRWRVQAFESGVALR